MHSARHLSPAVLLLVLHAFVAGAAEGKATPKPTDEQVMKLLRVVDERSRNHGDLRALVVAETKKEDTVTVRELQLFRRDGAQKFMILLTAPKIEAGKGYLSEGQNLWMYDPRVGRWDRRTEREAIGGTDSRRSDLDHTRFAEEYEARFEAEEKLGEYRAWRLALKARPGKDVAHPVLKLWIDLDSGNLLKRQEISPSGKLLRTAFFPKWHKVEGKDGSGGFWYPAQIRIFDELLKGNSTAMVIKTVDLRPLSENVFTKAWLESKSR